MSEAAALLQFVPAADAGRAALRILAGERDASPVNPLLLGKFCEHLGANIYHGMEAQIVLNPTLARWRFSAGDNHPDGGVREESDRERVEARIRGLAAREAWPEAEALVAAYFDGGAYGWSRVGTDDAVVLGPEVGPHGGRAQRVEVRDAAAPAGIGQWVHLPLHRVRAYEYRVVARALGGAQATLTLALAGVDAASGRASEPAQAHTGAQAAAAGASATAAGAATDRDTAGSRALLPLTDDWQTFTGQLRVGAAAPAAGLYRLTLTVEQAAHLEVDRVLLYPVDHVHGADPEVVAWLRTSQLPLLRWPGGNFVSGYRWRDGVGPVDQRPTVPNPAWEGLECHLFGTDEFLRFCAAVGCEPLICVNAGDGSAAEAAAWVEYCNGDERTPMGRLRAANGHPEPYGVRWWEIGNEVHGRWQVGWTTPDGNLDRYRRFREAMLAADPEIELIGCGHGNEPESVWNQRLIEGAADQLTCLSDHILTGGPVGPETSAVELFHAFMGYPQVLATRYQALRHRMLEAGIRRPRLAITELQLFAHFRGTAPAEARLTPAQMPTPDTMAEALSLAAILHTCIRLGDFVALLTHSATVNHGGGLRKQRERVFANPVHYAHALAAPLAGGQPVPVQLSCGTFSTATQFGHIPPLRDVPCLEPLAVLTPAGELVILVVHRGGDCGPIQLTVEMEGFAAAGPVQLAQLAGVAWWDRNTLQEPERVAPVDSALELPPDGRLRLQLPPFSLTRLTVRG